MNCFRVREILALIRPDSRDADQPEYVSEMMHLEHCAQCQAYFENQQRADRELSQAMRKVTVPSDLKSRLLAQIAAATPAGPTALTAEPVNTLPAESSVTAVNDHRDRNRRQMSRRVATVASALLLIVGLGSWWLFYGQSSPTLSLNQVVNLVHLPLAPQGPAFQGSFQPELPVTEIRLPALVQTLKSAYSLRDHGREIGALIPFQVSNGGRRPLAVILAVINLRQVDVSDLKSVGTSFLRAGVSYPPPNSYATRTWRVGQNLYVCYVISRHPEDLDSLKNQQAAT